MVKPMKLWFVVGWFMSLAHLIWALAVAIMPQTMQTFLDRIFDLHFLQPVWVLTQASLAKWAMLVILTFVVGWIMGNVLGRLWNMAHKK